ncbi:MAG: hypothetical protein S0880_37825 [Actinomycetota bacterium]|nr:hypothetical protein [Actinomycetota bacterium]
MSDVDVRTVAAPPTEDDRVPVDQRVGGFDKRTIWPGVVLLVVWFLWAHVVPGVNSLIDWDDPTDDGDLIDLGAGELTFEAAGGWNLAQGVRVDDDNISGVPIGTGAATLESDELTFEVHTAAWDGTPTELLDRVLEIDDELEEVLAEDLQDRVRIASVDGVAGEAVSYLGVDQGGIIAVYVFELEDGQTIGVDLRANGQPDAEGDEQEIAEMLTSVRYQPNGDEETG